MITEPYAAPVGTGIGHMHLRVADLDRSIVFYGGVLGFYVQARVPGAAFLGARLSADPDLIYHHHIGLNTRDSQNRMPPSRGAMRLHHAAFHYPSRIDLAVAVRR